MLRGNSVSVQGLCTTFVTPVVYNYSKITYSLNTYIHTQANNKWSGMPASEISDYGMSNWRTAHPKSGYSHKDHWVAVSTRVRPLPGQSTEKDYFLHKWHHTCPHPPKSGKFLKLLCEKVSTQCWIVTSSLGPWHFWNLLISLSARPGLGKQTDLSI